jgi:lipopolysaccharide/colanic/teichoic acid biosynthesis glycosyltransferase
LAGGPLEPVAAFLTEKIFEFLRKVAVGSPFHQRVPERFFWLEEQELRHKQRTLRESLAAVSGRWADDDVRDRSMSKRAECLKRGVDLVVGTVLLLLVLPVIALATIGVTISLRSWPFFTQTRIGRDGREFRFLKLRTLPTRAPRYASKYDLTELRIPRFCVALRRLHLDELPQLFLVLVGKMSLVGPRPEMPFLYDRFTTAFATERTTVRPGCTGLWQVSERCEQMIHEHPEFDAHYLRNQSVRFDLWIMTRTVRMHLPRGAKHVVSLTDLPAWARSATPVSAADAPLLLRTTEEPSTISATDLHLEGALQGAEA